MAKDPELERQGNRLKQARIAAGYDSVDDAARALGEPYSTYAGHENGHRGYAKKAAAYALKFKCRADWLLTGRGAMKADAPDLFAGLSAEKIAEVIRFIEFSKQNQRD